MKCLGRLVVVCTVALAAALPAGMAGADTTIKIVVPSTPGGGADVLARMLADQISRAQGRTLVVENRPGAGNTIGTEAVARSAPDGNTLLITTPEFIINPHLRKLNYDPLTGFAQICLLARSPQLLMVNPASPYRTLKDLLDAAKAKPGEITLASAGPASSPHVVIERLKREAKVDITYVPFQGTGPALNALLGQHVSGVLASYPNVAGQIKSGQLRAVVTPAASRVPDLPDVQTITENGFKDFDFDLWFGLVAPAGTPKDKLDQYAEWFKAALKDKDIQAKAKAQGLFEVGACGSEADAFTRKQHEEYGKAIRDAGIKVN